MTVYVSNFQPRYEPWPDWTPDPDADPVPPDMPFSTRLRLGKELNQLWVEFVTEMHDGPLTGDDVADKFWKYVTR